MRWSFFAPLCISLVGVLAVPGALGGITSGTIVGQVRSSEGVTLPGASVAFTSPSLQGPRAVIAGEGGLYRSPALPPGTYDVRVSMSGHVEVTAELTVGAGASVEYDASLPVLSELTERVRVTVPPTRISNTQSSGQTIEKEDVNRLPVSRTLREVVSLGPGVAATGPEGRLTISGAQSWENLFMVDGVTMNENVRGQPLDLYIEDAIEQTTVTAAAISAEYGRFSGGVVNAVTKSGGNDFQGSVRVGFENEDWKGKSDLSPDQRNDETNETFEGTIGGPILEDRLWFFAASRLRDDAATVSTTAPPAGDPIPYERGTDQERLEFKLTGTIAPKHQVQATYAKIEETQSNVPHGNLPQYAVLTDDGTLDDREIPQELVVVNYTGILGKNTLIEAQYAERERTAIGGGGRDTTISGGTPVFDTSGVNPALIYNESYFCGHCRADERDNRSLRLKGSYFLTSDRWGSHDLAGGVEQFEDLFAVDNHQSATDLVVFNASSVSTDYSSGVAVPEFQGGGATALAWFPILYPTKGTDFVSQALWVNDSWRANAHWSFNLGLRYDRTDAQNSMGIDVADSDLLSPRLGATYRQGSHTLRGAAGRYSGPISTTIFNTSSPAGLPAEFDYQYDGPTISGLPAEAAVQQAFDWLFAACPSLDLNDPSTALSCGGVTMTFVDIPGVTTVLADDLRTTSADDLSFGYQYDFGSKGTVRADVVHRVWNDLFMTRRDLTTGTGLDDLGNVFDRGVVMNAGDGLRREYDGLHVMWDFRLMQRRLDLGGNFTWSHARGNFDGENAGGPTMISGLSGNGAGSVGEYPEYKQTSWNAPDGDLSVDQRLRLRAWAMYQVLRNVRHSVDVGWIENVESGRPYSAVARIDSRPYVVNPGYETPPSRVDYFMSGRGEFTTDDIHRSDVALTYAYLVRGGSVELFVQPQIKNLFNEDGAIEVNRSVSMLAAFNPFTETPVEGVHWQKGPDFGQPTSEAHLQSPRELRFSTGARFRF